VLELWPSHAAAGRGDEPKEEALRTLTKTVQQQHSLPTMVDTGGIGTFWH